MTQGECRDRPEGKENIDRSYLPDPCKEAREIDFHLEGDTKIRLNVSWPILSTGGLPEASVACCCIEASVLSRPVKCVKELHSEDHFHIFGKHGNLFGEIQVFVVAGEFADRECSRGV